MNNHKGSQEEAETVYNMVKPKKIPSQVYFFKILFILYLGTCTEQFSKIRIMPQVFFKDFVDRFRTTYQIFLKWISVKTFFKNKRVFCVDRFSEQLASQLLSLNFQKWIVSVRSILEKFCSKILKIRRQKGTLTKKIEKFRFYSILLAIQLL